MSSAARKRAPPTTKAGARKKIDAEKHALLLQLREQLERCLTLMSSMRSNARLLAREPFAIDAETYHDVEDLIERMHTDAVMTTYDFARWRFTLQPK